MTWILVVLFYAGAMSDGDSVAITSVPGFKTQQSCVVAGNSIKPVVAATYKEVKFVCVAQ